MTKEILLDEDARKAIKEGMDAVGNVVKISLGAAGRNVVLSSGRITKDGFNITKDIRFSDPRLSIGAELIKKVARKTVDETGDNTTTATLLAQVIVAEGFKLLSAGHKGVELKRGIDKAVTEVVSQLKASSKPIEIDSEELRQIAMIAGNNDSNIGEMIFDAFQKTGKDGVIKLEKTQVGKCFLDVKEGIVFERGYLNDYFITNHEKLSCELNNPYIIIVEGKVSSLKDINPILQQINGTKREVLMIAEDFDGEALYTINTNRVKNNFPICLVKAPSFGDNQKQMLKDIAAAVGANVCNDESGLRLDTIKLTDLGTTEKVVVTREETSLICGGGKKQDIEERVRFIRKSIELADVNNDFNREQLEARLAKLTGGIAIIYVGAPIETEIDELRDRYDDAVRATYAAISEGVVVGGGISLIRCIDKLNDLSFDSDDEKAGIKLIQKVLEAPFIQMAENAELSNRIKVSDVLGKDHNYGYNFKTDKFEDLVKAGVVDPLKVVRVALTNAASFGGSLLTMGALTIPEKQEIPAFIPPHLR